MSKGTPLWTFRKKKLSYIFFYISRLISGLRVEWANKSFFEFFFWCAFFFGGGVVYVGSESFFMIPFVGCLHLGQEISDSTQKESAQTDPPGLRKHPKTVSVPPPGGGQEFFGVRLVPLGVYTIHPNPFPTQPSSFKTGRLTAAMRLRAKIFFFFKV